MDRLESSTVLFSPPSVKSLLDLYIYSQDCSTSKTTSMSRLHPGPDILVWTMCSAQAWPTKVFVCSTEGQYKDQINVKSKHQDILKARQIPKKVNTGEATDIEDQSLIQRSHLAALIQDFLSVLCFLLPHNIFELIFYIGILYILGNCQEIRHL